MENRLRIQGLAMFWGHEWVVDLPYPSVTLSNYKPLSSILTPWISALRGFSGLGLVLCLVFFVAEPATAQ